MNIADTHGDATEGILD